MTRHILALALLVALSAASYADAGDKTTKTTQTGKGHAGLGPIVFTKHVDMSSPYMN
jgi:hypothetical protein